MAISNALYPFTYDEYFNGILDEARLSNVVRSSDWIETEYNNQYNPSTFYSLGSQVSQEIETGNWTDSGYSIENNTLYHFDVDFEKTYNRYKNLNKNKWKLTVNYTQIIGIFDLLDGIDINQIQFKTNISDMNYNFIIYDLDFSWIEGYHEYLPLNESTYSMYKRESYDNYKENSEYFLNPNENIIGGWYTSSYAYVDEYPDTESPAIDILADYYDSGTYIQHGFNGTSINGKTITKIQASIQYGFTWHAVMNDIVIYYLYDGSTLLQQKTITTPSTTNPLWSYYDFENLNITDLSNIQFRIRAPTGIESGWGFEIDCYYLRLFYDDLELDIEKEIEITYEHENAPVLFTLYYSLTSDIINNNISLYIWNYDIQEYVSIDIFTSKYSFTIKQFIFNESAYFRLDKFKIKIESICSLNFNIFIDLFSLSITYIVQNTEGYQEIIAYNHRYTESNEYKGYSQFELKIYNDSIKYRYSEINFYADDYIYVWTEYNTTNINVRNIEVQSHVRYGLNTLDIEIINFYYVIYINYDYMIEFREQSRKELETHKIKSSFNYTSFNRNYVDLTGIIGNYSYNCFKGCRSLYGSVSEDFHRYFTIPFFSDDIDISIPLDLPDGDLTNPDEPEPPTQYYWIYETFKTEFHTNIPMNIGNWSVDFPQMRSSVYTAKYFYQPESISRDDLGSWRWKIKFSDAFSYTVDFNFMRNAFKSILNLILLFTQWTFFLVVASLSYVFMYLGTMILVFLWNVLVYAIFYALLTILWYLYLGIYLLLFYIWEGLVWVYENLLIPFLQWFWDEGIPIIIEWLITILAHIITSLIYLITLGQIDYDATYKNVYNMLRYIADEIMAMILVFSQHLDYLLIFILYYLLLVGLLYIRYIYVKARGFNNRAKQLYNAFEVFSLPIRITIDLFRETKELVNPYS